MPCIYFYSTLLAALCNFNVIGENKMPMRVLNIFAILLIFGVLGSAFAFQLQLSELPCSMCFLQRFGLLCAAFGLLLNLRFGFRASHYAVTLVSLVFTSWVALNQ